MKNILVEGSGVLNEVARERMLLVFDFDGTLAPIVDRPEQAAMRETTHTLLRLAAFLYPCAVVSGRSRSDLVPRLEGVPLVGVVGNHGAEAGFGPVDRSMRRAVLGWRSVLEAHVRDLPGIQLEDKGLSIAVHYRKAPCRAAARRLLFDLARTLDGARVFGGRAVVNLVPAGAHDKGLAVTQLLSRLDLRRAFYVGDDTTDEDAFRSGAVSIGVRVGRTSSSVARYYIPAQHHIDEILRGLVRARRTADGFGGTLESLERIVESMSKRREYTERV